MTDHIPALLDRVDAELMRRDLFHIAKDPLPCRSMVHTRPGATQPTLYEADDYIAEQLAGWGYDVEREACQVAGVPSRRGEAVRAMTLVR